MGHRLLLLTENYPPDRGGMAESCDRIVRGLRRARVTVDVVHFDRRTADPAHAINLEWNRLAGQAGLPVLHNTTHVVAFGGTLPLLAAPVFAAWLHRPLVTLLRGNELDAGLFEARRRPILEDAIRRSAAVCTVTSAQAEKVAALFEIEPHVIVNGIDFDLWQATDGDRARGARWRAENVAPDKRVLGLFGHLKSKKGVPFFVQALLRSGLAERFHLLLVGELEETPIESAHTLLPSRDRFELLPLYTTCDLVVLPSHYDGFPNVLIEAMALGIPLLASSVGGMRDVLTDGENAFLFAPSDEHACIDAVRRAAAASDETLARMGAHAQGVARTRCDAADETRRYLDVLKTAQEEFHENRNLRPRAVAFGLR